MRYWALLVAFLYCLVLVVLTIPVAVIAFWPDTGVEDAAGLFSGDSWPYWVFIAVMGLCQIALLVVPVGVANRRPVSRRSLLLPVGVTGLMMGVLVIGALFSLEEVIEQGTTLDIWMMLALGGLMWLVWTVVFYRLSREENPTDQISRLCRFLLAGSILELLIAVPSHIIARSKDYCCAGLLTFIGLTLGISVMLFSFGPGVFFLFLDRWKRLYQRPSPDQESNSV